jgi:hypothetical protein
MVGFVLKDKKNSYVELDMPTLPMSLSLGQSYIYEDEVTEGGRIDHAIFTVEPAQQQQHDQPRHDRDAQSVMKASRMIKNDPHVLDMVAALRNSLCPLPTHAKKTILLKRLSKALGGDSVNDVALEGFVKELITNLSYKVSDILDSLLTQKAPGDFDAADVLNAGSDAEFVAHIGNPFARIDSSREQEIKDVPDVKPLDSTHAAVRKANADITGDFRPVKHKWRAMLSKHFEVLISETTLWEFFDRVCITLGRNTQLGAKGLAAVTTAFIANDEEMLNLVPQANHAMEQFDGNFDALRRAVLSGACPPSFIEICVLSRIADVRTIILKRKFNGDLNDDNDIICMNNSPNTAKHVVVFQHKVDNEFQRDTFQPIVFSRRDVVFQDSMFSNDFKRTIAERCSSVNCWDDRCTLVIEDIAQKKREHMDSLLFSTIKKMYRKKYKS